MKIEEYKNQVEMDFSHEFSACIQRLMFFTDSMLAVATSRTSINEIDTDYFFGAHEIISDIIVELRKVNHAFHPDCPKV